jgi:superfamily II DNA/RNA helicase
MTFDNLDLHPKILEAIAAAGYSEPTEVQKAVIPVVKEGVDIRASAQTGTGKTAAFLLPAINHLVTSPSKGGKGPRVLILVPTRELAMQIETQAKKYTKFLPHVKSVSVVGGVPYHKQAPKLRRSLDILIATPGRLIDFIHQKKIEFPRLEMLILDEADRMLDMGFVKPVEDIASKTPSDRQTLMFSATMQGSVVKLSRTLLNNPKEIAIASQQITHENIEQKVHFVDDLHHKNRILDHILSQDEVTNAIVFTSTKRHAGQLVDDLRDKGFPTGALHGDMNQRQRTRTISELRNGSISILVATDVASRGIDVQAISHVINFDIPENAEDYVHRIGRTGRAGAKGIALTFVAGRDTYMMKQIEKFTGQQIESAVIPGLEPDPAKISSNGSPRKSRNHRADRTRSPRRSSNKPAFTRGDKKTGSSWGDKRSSSPRGEKSAGSSWGDKRSSSPRGEKSAGSSWGDKRSSSPRGEKKAGSSWGDNKPGSSRGNKKPGFSFGNKKSLSNARPSRNENQGFQTRKPAQNKSRRQGR